MDLPQGIDDKVADVSGWLVMRLAWEVEMCPQILMGKAENLRL